MAIGGYGEGGASYGGRASTVDLVPYRGYRDQEPWVEELLNALGAQWDIWDGLFCAAEARVAALTPTATPPGEASDYLATPLEAPLLAPSQDTLLDMLLFLAGVPWPVDGNVTLETRQALAAEFGAALLRKGNRRELLRIASILTDGPVLSWTQPPDNFSIVIPDGSPSPGHGSWCARVLPLAGSGAMVAASGILTGTATAFHAGMVGSRLLFNGTAYAVLGYTDPTHLTLSPVAPTTGSALPLYLVLEPLGRPWILDVMRRTLEPLYSKASVLGIGYAQFRAGYSAAGEVVMPVGSRISLVSNEHFSSWTAGVADSWTVSGSGGSYGSTVLAPEINREFSDYAAVINLSGVAMGGYRQLSQAVTGLDYRLPWRFELDYQYRNDQVVNVLEVQIYDVLGAAFYDASTATWVPGETWNTAPGSASRTRYAIDLGVNPAGGVDDLPPSSSLVLRLRMRSDETGTTQLSYVIYRCAFYQCYSYEEEQLAAGERTLWVPYGRVVESESYFAGTGKQVVPYDAAEAELYLSDTATQNAYHPALSGPALRTFSGWLNLLLNSRLATTTGWTLGTATASTTPGPYATPANATLVTPTGASGYLEQTDIVSDPSGGRYACGVWLQCASGTLDVDVSLRSGAAILNEVSIGGVLQGYTQRFTVTPEWRRYALRNVAAGAASNPLGLRFAAAAPFAAACAYCYPTSSKAPSAMRPPVFVSETLTTATSGRLYGNVYRAAGSVLDANTLRPLISLQRGALSFTVVPVFSKDQPTATLLDLCVAGVVITNRLTLRVSGGILTASQRDAAGLTRSCSLTLSAGAGGGRVQWVRDTAILVRLFWDAESLMLGAGDGNAQATSPVGWVATDAGLDSLTLGGRYDGGETMDGYFTNLEAFQIGSLPA